MKTRLLLLLSVLLITMLSPIGVNGSAAAQLEAVVKAAQPFDYVPVLITLADRVDLDQYRTGPKAFRRARLNKAMRRLANESQGQLRTFLADKGAARIRPIWLINAVAATVPVAVASDLTIYPGVESVVLDYNLTTPQVVLGSLPPVQWNLEAVGCPGLWELGYRGQGVVVASMDTGVDSTHPDLQGKWRGGHNSWFDPHGEHITPFDTHGHGTQTMGVMIGGDPDTVAIGAAPDARWIAVKMFNDAGNAGISDIHLGYQWLFDPDDDPDTDDAPDIVNNSWSIHDQVDLCVGEFLYDVTILKISGIAVVFAAGNEGPLPSTTSSPANYADSFAVGAVDENNAITPFSSRGPSPCYSQYYPDIVAPGMNIITTDLSIGGLSNYVSSTGTSYAAPHVTGVMALLLSAFPELDVYDLESALRLTAADLGVEGPDHTYGYGMLNAENAYSYLITRHTPSQPDTDGVDTDGDGDPANDYVFFHMAATDGFTNMADYKLMYTFGFTDMSYASDIIITSEASLSAELPGPTIALKQGQRLFVSLTNITNMVRSDITAAHTIHWHGYPQAAPVFGGDASTSFTANPAAGMMYFYTVTEPGTYMWDCGVDRPFSSQMGMTANLYVRPIQNNLPDDCDLQEFTHQAGFKYAYNDGDGSTLYDVEFPIQLCGFDPNFHDAIQTGGTVSLANLADKYPMMNGRGYPDTLNTDILYNSASTIGYPSAVSSRIDSLIEAAHGEKVLLRLSNHSTTRHYTLTCPPLNMTVVGRGARMLRNPSGRYHPLSAASVTVHSGQTLDVILDTSKVQPGTYFLYTTNLNYLSNNTEDFGGVMTEIIIRPTP